MKNKKIALITLLTGMAIIHSCLIDKFDKKLRLVNDTRMKFFQVVDEDTALLMKDVFYIDSQSIHRILRSNDTLSPIFAFTNRGGFARKINEECLDSTMYLYLFEMDSVKKYGWDFMISQESMYIRKGYKVKDLDSLQWVINLSSLIRK